MLMLIGFRACGVGLRVKAKALSETLDLSVWSFSLGGCGLELGVLGGSGQILGFT